MEVREVVADVARGWPKALNATQLISQLDGLARRACEAPLSCLAALVDATEPLVIVLDPRVDDAGGDVWICKMCESEGESQEQLLDPNSHEPECAWAQGKALMNEKRGAKPRASPRSAAGTDAGTSP